MWKVNSIIPKHVEVTCFIPEYLAVGLLACRGSSRALRCWINTTSPVASAHFETALNDVSQYSAD